MNHVHRLAAIATAAMLVAAGCSSDSEPTEIVLLTHSSFALSEGILDQFADETGVSVVIADGGDAGTMLNQAILTKDNPIADVIFGVDNSFVSRAIANDLFDPYTAEGVDRIDQTLRLAGDPATPIDYGDVCINYDIAALAELGLAIPTSLDDLVTDAYRDLLVVQDPATSSPGLAFLLATIDTYPEGSDYDWRDYWRDLFDNGVNVASDWSEAYYAEFTRAGGTRPLVVSYASSPPAEVFFGETDDAPTGSMTEGCFRQVEYAGVLNGTDQPETARRLIDFLLSTAVQNDIPLTMFVYPVNPDSTLPDVFIEHTVFAPDPILVDPGSIDDNRDRWIEEWTAIARS